MQILNYTKDQINQRLAGVSSLGNAIGMRGWNQLLYTKGLTSTTTEGITYTINSNGSISASGTATSISAMYLNITLVATHKYFCGIIGATKTTLQTTGHNLSSSYIHTAVSGETNFPRLRIASGETVNETLWVNIIDLTALFGSGNEPATVDEFRAMFPADYYPYCSGSFGDLLWTNASPTSAFAGQTISLDLSEYKWVGIVSRQSTSSSYFYDSKMMLVGSYFYINSADCYIRQRLSRINSDGIVFYDCGYFAQYATSQISTDNTYLIPYQIYGIR